MGKYELIFILNPTIEQKEQKEIIKDIQNFIKTFAKITRKEVGKEKQLAYDIKGFKTGIFVYIDFEINLEYASINTKEDLERKIRLDERIIKYMMIREVQ